MRPGESNMPGYTSEDALRQDVEKLVAEKFGPFRASIDPEKVLPCIIYSRDVNEVLQAADLLPTLSATETAEQLAALNSRIEGLRSIHDVATAAEKDESLNELVHGALLSESEGSRLRKVVEAYRETLDKVGGAVATPEFTEEGVLGSITPDMVQSYVARLYDAGDWLKPSEALVSTDRLMELSKTPNGQIFQAWTKLFFDENHYALVIRRCEELHRPFLADIARLFLYQSRIVNGALSDNNFVPRNAGEIAAMLDRVDAYRPVDFSALEPIGGMVPMLSGFLRSMLGTSPFVPDEERVHHLEMAERQFDRSPVPMFRALGPSMRWTRAQLARGFERERLELDALNRVNELLAQSALEKEPVARLSSMAMLLALPAGWKLERGDFAGCVEAATTAKSMARAAVSTLKEESGPLLEELRKGAEDEDVDPIERAQLESIRSALVSMVENANGLELAMELLSLQALAKLAEAHSRFEEAYAHYQQASKLQGELLQSARKLMQTFTDTVDPKQFAPGFQHEARADYFQGMASLNKGDQNLMNLDFKEATASYQEARASFAQAADLWTREAGRLTDVQGQSRSKADLEASTCQDRIRYCDARLEMTDAERLSSLDQHWEAAKRFEKAAGIFGELVQSTNPSQSARVAAIFKASQEICTARFLIDASRRTRIDAGSAQEVAELLDKASDRFTRNGEAQWGSYARALRYEYEAFVYYELARSAPRSSAPERERDAQRKVADAASILRQVGMENRATALEAWSRAAADRTSHVFTAVMLPKPGELAGVGQPNLMEQFSTAPAVAEDANSKTEESARKLLATSIVLEGRLSDLRDRRDRGRVDDGQYTDLAKDLDKERVVNLLALQTLLKGRSQTIDEVLYLAMSGSNPGAMLEKLAEAARATRLPQQTVDLIQRGEGSFFQWIVEVSFARADRVAAA